MMELVDAGWINVPGHSFCKTSIFLRSGGNHEHFFVGYCLQLFRGSMIIAFVQTQNEYTNKRATPCGAVIRSVFMHRLTAFRM